MGYYKISKEEILDAIKNALDNLEGDFTDKELKECLDGMKAYPYVSDKTKSEDAYKKILERIKNEI